MHNTSIPPGATTESREAKHWWRLAIGLWIALAVAVCVKSCVQQGEHSLYPVYAWGARHWWAGQSLYISYPKLHLDYWRYSPTYAILFTPFALLPDRLGASLWGILSVATIFWALHLMAREMLPGCWAPRREGLFLGLSALGSMAGIWSGQSNSLMLALV
ncbi:MAG: glycosyltransferase family 87 protein, partial [Thermoguttaceae bacterium]